jgi:NADH-quinone oxidoreductase subunit G
VRNGGRVVVIDPRPVELPCASDTLPLSPERLPMLLESLVSGNTDGLEPPEKEQVTTLLEQLGAAKRPIVVGGADLLGGQGVLTLCAAAEVHTTLQRMVGIMVLMAGPNSYGGALLAGDGPAFDTILDAIQEGKVRALVCLESDPFREAMDPARAQAALGRLELLVSIDATPSLAAERADIFLPARANAEMAGSYINNEGRLQAFLPVIEPGLPIRETGAGNHPPREFFNVTPGSAPEADWWILSRLLERDATLDEVRRAIEQSDERFVEFQELAAETMGLRLTARGVLPPATDNPLPRTDVEGSLKLLSISAPAGSHWLAHLSSPLAAVEPLPYVCLNAEYAAQLGFEQGDRARLTTRFGHCHVTVHVDRRAVSGLVLVPQLWDTALEGMVPGSMHSCRLEKEAKG